MADRKTFRQGGRGTRLQKLWVSIHQSTNGMDIAEGTTALGIAGGATLEKLTILRMRGLIGVQLDTSAVDERVLVVFGLIIVPTPAFVAGAASVPSPLTEDADDWLWQGSAFLTSLAEGAVATDFLSAQIPVDSKAMRIMSADETLILVAEIAESQDQAGTLDFAYSIRILQGL